MHFWQAYHAREPRQPFYAAEVRFLGKGKQVKQETLKVLVNSFGKRYSEVLDIELRSGEDREIFKWFLASLLFGAPIREDSAIKTYRCFEKYPVLTPKQILDAGWDGLVKILDEGGYTRYDFKTADKLLEVARNIVEKYGGSLKVLHGKASDPRDLERRLKDLGKGVGDITINIFLRELRGILEKARPEPSELVVLAAKNLGIATGQAKRVTLKGLEDFWRRNRVEGKSFVNFETALLRLGKDFYRKGKPVVLES
jgi:endonuclease III